MGAATTTPEPAPATEDTWMFPPGDGWTFDQVKHLELPFDWELVDGVIVARGQTNVWHNEVRDGIADALKAARVERYRVLTGQCVMVDDRNPPKPDVIVYDPRKLNFFEAECVPAEGVALVIEVVSPGSRQRDRVCKPALFAAAKVPCYWRVELDRDRQLAIHEYWLNADTRSYLPAPLHAVHHGKLITEMPFPVEIDVVGLVGF
ncbi:Uma2 family endonuclease [Streptomyces sp. KM273126]|uniref:Uma2 family endonuclease n=1 Tax=Streptomyces sp. KM273126 TaxID=2545247 RepID=UPI00103CBD46|nr:Uma2 family endonuclease [Streptomyces sp. KM273126]MBA2809687.1 Uma2 family endonuclease [Streptomyces sp. KM273126]